jgi:hypothetical protein
MISAHFLSSLQYSELVRSQTHPLFVRAYCELSSSLGEDAVDAAKAELDEDAIVCST